MSLYTTGEIANLANVSVRTIQYYDKKGILKPVKLSEGGRRLYDEESLKDLNLICLLKSIGLSLTQIKEIIGTDIKDELILDILDEQTKILKKETADKIIIVLATILMVFVSSILLLLKLYN